MEGMERLQFLELFTEPPVPPQGGGWSRWNILMCLICIYNYENYGLRLDLKDGILFLQSFFACYRLIKTILQTGGDMFDDINATTASSNQIW